MGKKLSCVLKLTWISLLQLFDFQLTEYAVCMIIKFRVCTILNHVRVYLKLVLSKKNR